MLIGFMNLIMTSNISMNSIVAISANMIAVVVAVVIVVVMVIAIDIEVKVEEV